MMVRGGKLYSIFHNHEWKLGWNTSKTPEMKNKCGFYFLSVPQEGHFVSYDIQVKCEIAGNIVIHTSGFRAEYARMVEVERFYDESAIPISVQMGLSLGYWASKQYEYFMIHGTL
jgi:hypothetical protein